MPPPDRHIASVSFGKDSLVMVLYILEHGLPLDEVMFYDTGMEFEAIYRIRDKLLPILASRGIRYTELSPPVPFLYDMLERPVVSKQKGSHFGYGWCGGVCRWGTTRKQQTLDAHSRGAAAVYIGFAADEPHRIQACPLPNAPRLRNGGSPKPIASPTAGRGGGGGSKPLLPQRADTSTSTTSWTGCRAGAVPTKTAKN